MKTSFIHAADIHLGYRQYNSDVRYLDFARAFGHIVDLAIEREVDFFLLAGDLFDQKTLGPQTLRQAEQALERLRDAHIPVYAVEGNHDQASRRYRNRWSWPGYLHHTGYLRLLSMSAEGFTGGDAVPVPGLRIVGVPYVGASLPRYIPQMVEHLQASGQGVEYTILMLHAGLEDVLPRDGFDTLRQEEIAPLREHVDYLALGHVHKAYQRDGWIYNPGAPEACSVNEGGWERGVYYVEVDTKAERPHRWQLLLNRRRPFYNLNIDATNCQGAEQLYTRVQSAALSDVPDDMEPVVTVWLDGLMQFSRVDYHPERVESAVRAACNPLLVRIKDQMSTRETIGEWDAHKSRQELDHEIFTDIARRDARYGKHAEAWAEVMAHVKQMALSGESGAEIADFIQERTAVIEGNDQ